MSSRPELNIRREAGAVKFKERKKEKEAKRKKERKVLGFMAASQPVVRTFVGEDKADSAVNSRQIQA